jgi:ankyrin repeat protein
MDTESDSDEEPPAAKRQRTTDAQTKSTGGAHDGGQQFEIKMAAVIGLRGMQRGDNFELATNVKDAGNFDDLVYTAKGRRYFLQLKHTENPDTTKFQPKELVELLHQCFESYYNIQDRHKSEFIIYTNKRLGWKLSGHKRKETVEHTVERVFKTSAKGEIFNFIRDKNKKLDVYSSVEKLVRESKEFGDLSVSEQKSKVSMISEFLKKLIMVTGQKGQLKLDKVIHEEIKNGDEIKVGRKVYEQVLRNFKTWIEDWWRNRNENMTPEILRNWLQKAKTASCISVVSSLFVSCTKKLFRTGINFSDRKISRLRDEISNNRAVQLRSDALTLCSILLLDCLDTQKCIFVDLESLRSHKNMLLYAWLGGQWESLIVSCDSRVQQSVISDACLKISEIINTDPSNKRVIILTEHSAQQIRSFVPVEHEFSFEQLSKKSQDMVLDQKIDFQGSEVTMRSVLQRHGNVQHVLGPELVTDMITDETPVNIGGKLHVNTDYYAPRVLERDIYLRLDILKDTDLRHDVFAVSGMRDEDFSEFVPAGEKVEKVTYSYRNGVIFDTPNESEVHNEVRYFKLESNNLEACYSMLCEMYSEKTLHWFELKKGYLLWIRSCGAVENLLNYVDEGKSHLDKGLITNYMKKCKGGINEDSIWDLGDKTVLVVAEPGMGKTSTTTQVARHTKERDPTSWVVHINWNDHTRKLQEIDPATFNSDTLVEFLCSAAFPDSKYVDINRSLLKQALQSSGNVTVLMDGFDEISPTHADKAAVILSELMKTRVERLWVTSRPVEKERLEKELSVIAYGMRKLSRASQEYMLIILWKPKTGEEETTDFKLSTFIYELLRDLNDLFYEDNFTGCPLYITMIATVYEMEVKACLSSTDLIEPRIDLVNLYEKFVERKLHIYLTQKQKADITNSSVQDDNEILKKEFLKNFEKCALVDILPPSLLQALHSKKIEEEIRAFLGKVQAGKDKRGVVMNVVEGKPQFVHRTFAEYFTARWFSKNFKPNRSVLEHILFDPEYSFVRDMFDRMMATRSSLHCAVLQQDIKRVETLLGEGSDIKTVDKGGRSVMHLFAARRRTGRHYHTQIMDFMSSVSHCDVPLDNTDCVLQWTPLQYAIKSGDCCTVEWLLERNVDRTGLDMIRQWADDPDYIDPIIIQAAMEGHALFLECLRSIGVNIHQARSRKYPSPLHAAIHGEELPVVRWLIKHGADCNIRYSNGQTPLFHAVTRGSLDVVRALVEEGGASMDVRDDCGRTAIDWVIDYTSILQNPESITRKYHVERLKEIVRYLEESVCKESSSV